MFYITRKRMFSKEDIAAMKLNAICGRKSKKDCYDIYSLLHMFSLPDILSFYDEKFQSDNSYMALRSLQYFEDAEVKAAPGLIQTFPSWDKIKDFLVKKVNDFKL